MIKRVELVAGKDERGDLEEFTWDLFPVVDPHQTTHLDSNGLPKVGTRIVPGMIIVGKIGKTQQYQAAQQPTALEIHGLPFEELRSRYGKMWHDSSLVADAQTAGIVREAQLEEDGGTRRAIVVLEQEVPASPKGDVPQPASLGR